MAIVIEEEGNKTNLVQVVTWLSVLGIVIVAVYFIFFADPGIINYATPDNIKNINALAPVSKNPNLDPTQISGTLDKSLKTLVTLPQPGNAGRANPFLLL